MTEALKIEPALLALLRCPRSGQVLHPADAAERSHWSQVSEAEDFLVTEDGQRAYPIEDGFPILLLDRLLEIPEVTAEA